MKTTLNEINRAWQALNPPSFMEPITKDQIKMIHAILPDEFKNDRELKADLVAQFTVDPDLRSTKDLNFLQANELIYFLYTGKEPTNEAWAAFDNKNARHRYILHLCHVLDWEIYCNRKGRMIADLDKLGAWLRKYGYLHKPLMSYRPAELGRLINQLDRVAQHRLSNHKFQSK